jgi:cell division protein FtsI (penicillin-binding protein 3)
MTNSPSGKWQLNLVYGLLVVAMGGLGVRLYQLITVMGPRAVQAVQRQEWVTVPEPGKPGGIYVRANRSLVPVAESRQVPSIFVDPNVLLVDPNVLALTADKLGKVLGMNPVRVQEMVYLRDTRRFTWIKREVEPAEANAVRSLRLPGVGILYEWRREYPNGSLAGSVVGFAPSEDPNVKSGAGVEKKLHRVMEAQDGYRTLVADVSRRPITQIADKSELPQDGSNVVLCIDASAQAFLEKAVGDAASTYQGKWAAGVTVIPATGEILAMCSVPGINPNEFRHADPNQRTNRAIELPYEPGSVAKPIFAAAAVEYGAATYDTMIFCENGPYAAPGGGTIKDHGGRYLGMISLRDVIVHSSNVGMAKVGEKLGNRRIFEIERRFGLGQDTGIDLPGESKGIVRRLNKMDGYSLRRVPFGQEVSVTTLQLAMAFSAIANGGELLRPRIVDRILDADGQTVKEFPRKVVRRVLSKRVADETVSVMADVVERGTGKGCQLTRWTSFGKTGTAQIAARGGYAPNAYVASFVGGAPVHSPRVLCIISVYWPRIKNYYGGTVAAPAVKEVLEQTLSYLDVPPDKIPDATPPPHAGARGGAAGHD